ncbi:MAG TPA: hypothetical protein PKM48_03060 [Parvularculaceae bacterium]|nr:hypothetical protein [Parvularculaceae bacterium]
MRRNGGAGYSISAGGAYFTLMPETAHNDKKEREKMAKMLSATAAAIIVIAALFPAVYTFASFA